MSTVYQLWEVKWGRIYVEKTLTIACLSFQEAVDTAVKEMQEEKPTWNADQDDILSMKRLDISLLGIEEGIIFRCLL